MGLRHKLGLCSFYEAEAYADQQRAKKDAKVKRRNLSSKRATIHYYHVGVQTIATRNAQYEAIRRRQDEERRAGCQNVYYNI